MSVIVNDRIEYAMQRQIRREMSRQSFPYFVVEYFTDDFGQPLLLENFHVEMCSVCQSDRPEDERVIFLEPAAHGKTTHVCKHYPIWLSCMDPDVRIALMSKTFDDTKARLSTIKAEMEGNEKLIADFGPFIGDKWTDDGINVAQRTVRVKEPTINVFGSETNVFGWRATHFIGDDIVTLQNSGPQVTDGTRRRLRENFNQGVRKMGYPGRPYKIRWVQTVVDLRDLVHEMAAPMPSDDREQWTSVKGFKVIKRQALNERTGEVLWPAQYTREQLEAERAQDPISFLKRMQNRCVEQGMMTFQPEWFMGNTETVPPLPGCLDYNRVIGQMPQKPGLVKTAGYDPNPGLSETSKYCGYVEIAADRMQDAATRVVHVLDIERFRDTIEGQAKWVVGCITQRGLAIEVVETNAANQWLMQLENVRNARSAGYRIEPHHTNVKNKPDPDIGIPALAALVREGRLRLPYGDMRSRQLSDLLVTEMVQHPMSVTSDLLMALWFAVIGLDRLHKQSRIGIISQSAPAWLDRHGVSLGTLRRWAGGN